MVPLECALPSSASCASAGAGRMRKALPFRPGRLAGRMLGIGESEEFGGSAGSQGPPLPVGTPPSLSAAQCARTWTAGSVAPDWVWGPQPYGGRWGTPTTV